MTRLNKARVRLSDQGIKIFDRGLCQQSPHVFVSVKSRGAIGGQVRASESSTTSSSSSIQGRTQKAVDPYEYNFLVHTTANIPVDLHASSLHL